MSRLSRRRSLTVASAAALVALVAPAAAHGAAYTAKPGDGACGAGDLACGGLVEAAEVMGPGDSLTIGAGTYPGAVFVSGGLTITGDIGVTINSTVEFRGAVGGVSKFARVIVAQGSGGGPGVLITGSSGVEITDSAIASKDGDGVHVANGTLNKIVRSAIVTGGAQASAVKVNSTAGNPKGLTIESTILVGGAAGVGATTSGATAPDIQLTLRHITAAGSTNGISLDSSAAGQLLGSSGSIAATLTDSIALNNATKRNAGVAGLGANSAEINAARSLQSGDVKVLFLDPLKGNYRLRPDSPAIGKGGFVAGESTTDIDGEDRSAPPTDQGADEYNNAAPTAKFVVATPTPRNSQPVKFDATGSSDREGTAGGGIAEYRWRYSDGGSDVTTVPTVEHVFADEGDAAAGLIVIDKQGAVSPEVAVTFKLVDGVPPAVGIAKPKANQTFRLFTSKTTTVTKNGKKTKVTKRTRTKVQIGGLSADKSGVARIILTLEKAGPTTAKPKAGATARCRFYDPRKGFQLVRCTKPKLITARLIKDDKNGQWTYTIQRPLFAGRYTVSAYGVDGAGAFGNSAEAKLAKISFTMKK